MTTPNYIVNCRNAIDRRVPKEEILRNVEKFLGTGFNQINRNWTADIFPFLLISAVDERVAAARKNLYANRVEIDYFDIPRGELQRIFENQEFREELL